ncbi:TetR/AcrR family transcriptional regulator [Hyalangium minutum]|uniref:Transcriptional regulator, TetR family protein n=1 Tax=Hyalangium minutum TaxID=394096 RepID=A0A085WEV8_9BACT|nr:TetR/AcrR family transcriptional regulator [Hyalangium minutum]KFE66221.1 Transcriptional regulator, TetR family protein [Hyalangium minutum]
MAQRSRSVPRKKPRQERSRATVDAILEAAAHILVAHGFEDTTTRQVAERAGVSIGSLYQYFPSKEALITALFERQIQRVLDVCTEALQSQGSPSTQQVVRDVALGVMKAYAVNPRLHQVLISEGLKLGMMERVQSFEQRIETVVRTFMLHYSSQLRSRRVELATFVITRAIRGIIWSAAIERPELFEDPELADELGELMLGYLLPTSPSRSAK